MSASRPGVCVVGPMVGRNPGLVTTQGERLSDLFSGDGYRVIEVSKLANRYLRPFDIVGTLIVRRREYDIAVLQVFGGPSFLVEDVASRLLERMNCPIVMVLRGGGMPAFASDHPAWTRTVLKRASVIVTPSKYLALAMMNLGFKTLIIPNVIELEQYPYRHRSRLTPRLFWMRSFHHVYNPQLAIQAFAHVRRVHPDATLVMGGPDKGELESTRRLAHSLGVAEGVEFPGFLDPASKIRFFHACDVYVNTNRIDNMPVAVLEACACGVPVVSTRVGGVPYLLSNRENALLVGDDDPVEVADAVLELLEKPELAARLSRNGRALAERSAVSAVLPRWHDLLASVRSHS